MGDQSGEPSGGDDVEVGVDGREQAHEAAELRGVAVDRDGAVAEGGREVERCR